MSKLLRKTTPLSEVYPFEALVSEAAGQGNVPVGTTITVTEDGAVTWRGEVVECDGEEWRGELCRVLPPPARP